MNLEINHPLLLILLPVCITAVAGLSWWDRHCYQEQLKNRRLGEVILRCLVLSAVILALAGISVQKKSEMVTNIYLVDLSDSLMAAREDEAAFVREAIARQPEHNQSGIVVFGSDAKIEQFVTDKKVFSDIQSEVSAYATNLEQAVQTGLALFPDDSAKRLVLLTDGAENEGELARQASAFSGSGAELSVVKFDSTIDQEVYVSDVKLPERISEGDSFEVRVSIFATEPTVATVTLFSGKTAKGRREVSLQKGENALVFPDQGVESGIQSYRVTVEAAKDTLSVNNTYSAFTAVTSRSRILLVEGSRDESESFVPLLEAGNFVYDVVTPTGVPIKMTDLLQYKSVILLNVYADDLREGFMDTISSYVKDYAGGLVMLGGPNSYALGNYRNTPVEEVLPVKMELEGEKQIPKVAMVMVIDHSGSMSATIDDSSRETCMDLAKQAAINALDSLRPIDEVGVVAFDDSFTWSVPLQMVTDTEEIAERISGISVRGGTSIYPAVDAALKKLKKSDATLRHIVLLTDGQDGYRAYDPLLEELEKENITLSCVAVGQDADTGLLRKLSEKGGGRFYQSQGGGTLPRIFAQEVYLSSKSYLVNEEFFPEMVSSHEILGSLFDQGIPSLLGYVATSRKASASLLLESSRKDPILAVWQCGLGRTAAWTSDGTGEWTANWSGWDAYASLWRNIIEWTVSDTSLGEDELSVSRSEGQTKIRYETKEYTGATKLSVIATDEKGELYEAALKATSPGVFEGSLPLAQTGVYSVNLRKQEGDEIVKNINTAAAVQYSREYRYGEVTDNLDSFVEQVGGRYIEQTREVFASTPQLAMARKSLDTGLLLAAVCLFLLDVVFRRMSIEWLPMLAGALGTVQRAVAHLTGALVRWMRSRKTSGAKRSGEEMRGAEQAKGQMPVGEHGAMQRSGEEMRGAEQAKGQMPGGEYGAVRRLGEEQAEAQISGGRYGTVQRSGEEQAGARKYGAMQRSGEEQAEAQISGGRYGTVQRSGEEQAGAWKYGAMHRSGEEMPGVEQAGGQMSGGRYGTVQRSGEEQAGARKYGATHRSGEEMPGVEQAGGQMPGGENVARKFIGRRRSEMVKKKDSVKEKHRREDRSEEVIDIGTLLKKKEERQR